MRATHCETRALQEALHGHELQPRVTPLPSYLIQDAGIGLQGVQGANGILNTRKTNCIFIPDGAHVEKLHLEDEE